MQYTTKDVYEFISKQTNDSILEWKTCAVSGAEFPVYKSDTEFYDKISPTFGGKKYQIPTPTLCPEERQRRRLLFRNERKLYKRKCDASGKDIISIYAPDAPYKVYDQNFRWSDDWNPLDYGREFDFSRNFSEQFGELMREVPRISLTNTNSENCEYCNPGFNNKNCYLVYSITNSEDCMYGRRIDYCKKSFDNLSLKHSELSYYCINCRDCFSCFGCNNLQNCSYCINCYDLIGVQYHINNKAYTKEQYEGYIKENGIIIDLQYISQHKKELDNFNNHDCIGQYITNSKACILCYDVDDSENLRYCDFVKPGSKNSIDNSLILSSEYIKEGMSSFDQYMCVGTTSSRGSKYIYYSDVCYYSHNLFGCVGLRNASYCIFNKQYSKEEYEALVPKLMEKMITDGERGEFFQPSLSPFSYNETLASEYFPLTREEALARGYRRQDNSYDPIIPEGASVVQSHQVENLKSDEEILKSIFICEVSGRPFRIIKQELEFYRKHSLPLPHKHPDVRHQERMGLRPARNVILRTCDECGVEMLSVYPQDYQGKVYCETCYNKEIYG